MSMWLTLAVGYCLVCWLTGYLLSRHIPWLKLIEDARHSGFALATFRVLLVVIMPITLPLLPYFIGRGRWDQMRTARETRRLHRQYREHQLIPVDGRDLAEPIHEHFVTHTPALRQLSCRFLGDYRLAPEPVAIYNRLFLSEDGDIVASVYAFHYSDTDAIWVGLQLLSVLADGTCVHSTRMDNPYPERSIEPADRLLDSFLPEATVEELYRQHRREIATADSHPLRFRPSQLHELGVYDQRVYSRWRYRHGDLDHEPPAPDFGSMLAPAGTTPPACDQAVVASSRA